MTKEIDPELDFSKRSSAKHLLQLWKCGQRHLNEFWKIRRNEYLLSLRERPQMHIKGPHSTAARVPRIGDVVLIKEDLPRGKWRIGCICELLYGLDQRIRSAMITVTPNKIIRRALSLLYPIECPDSEARDISKETATEENCADKLNIDDDENENRDVNHGLTASETTHL